MALALIMPSNIFASVEDDGSTEEFVEPELPEKSYQKKNSVL